MAKLFISYSHNETDKPKAEKLANALKAHDHDVWWDVDLHTGEDYEDKIEKILNESEAVIVIWSETSVKSRWVKAEASVAADKEKLLPVCFDTNFTIPVSLRVFHVTDLSSWDGSPDAPIFKQLDDHIARVQEGNFQATIRQAADKFGGNTTTGVLISRLFSNVGGLPMIRLVAGAAAAAGILVLLQGFADLLSGQSPLPRVIGGIGYFFVFAILRAAHQPIVLRIGRGVRKFFDDSFAFWLLFSACGSALFFALLSLGARVEPSEVIEWGPFVTVSLLGFFVLVRLTLTAFSFLLKSV